MTWVVGIFAGHGEIGVLGQGLGGNEMGGAIDAAVGLAIVPDAAHPILALKDVIGDAKLLEGFGGSNARRACADDAVLASIIRRSHHVSLHDVVRVVLLCNKPG